MYCYYCGHETKEGNFCANCGAQLPPAQEEQAYRPYAEQVYQPYAEQAYQPYAEQAYQPPPYEVTAAESKSMPALIKGILSIVLCFLAAGIILGPLAIAEAKRVHLVLDKSSRNWWQALAAIITGGIGIGLSVIFAIEWFVLVLIPMLASL